MKIVLAGGMTITGRLLEVLCEQGAKPVHLFAYPPSLAERSNYIDLEPLALKLGVPISKVKNINDSIVKDTIASLKPDWFMVFGWSQLVKEEILALSTKGTLGFHMTKLPEGRGRAPVAWTVIKGKTTGAVSLIWLRGGADNGEIALQRDYPITELDDAETVVNRVADVACEVMKQAVPMLRTVTLPKIPQDDSKATHWEARKPEDGIINWSLPVREAYNFIRGVAAPFPGAFFHFEGEKYLVWKAALIELKTEAAASGTVIGPYVLPGEDPEAGIAVAMQGGIIILKSVECSQRGKLGPSDLLELAKNWKGKKLEGKII